MLNIKKFRIKKFKKVSGILKLEKISLKFGKKTILDNLNLELNHGQILGLLGPNGVGKSTIFNLITGLISPDYGTITINNEIVNKLPIYKRALKFKIGFVPQYGGYFHDLTIDENLKAIAEITITNENIFYKGSYGSVQADNIEINLTTRNLRVFMNNQNDKIKIISNR